MGSDFDYALFDASFRVLLDPDGSYAAVGHKIPILVAGKGTKADALAHMDRAVGALGRHLVNHHGLGAAAAFLSARDVKYEMVDKSGARASDEHAQVLIRA